MTPSTKAAAVFLDGALAPFVRDAAARTPIVEQWAAAMAAAGLLAAAGPGRSAPAQPPIPPRDCPCQDWCGQWDLSTDGHHPSCDGHGRNRTLLHLGGA